MALRHAGHLDQQAEEDEQRHRQQDEVRHALVHAADHDEHRRVGGERQVGGRRQPEGEGDRHAGEHRHRDHAHEEDQQVDVAETLQDRLEQDHDRRPGRRPGPTRRARAASLPTSASRSTADHDHQAHADRERGGAPGVRDLQGRRGDEALLGGELEGRLDDDEQEGERGGDRHDIEERPHGRRHHAEKAVMRMCSPRRNATTAPSMASHRNRIEASSSDQTRGSWKT